MAKSNQKTQEQIVLEHLSTRGSITPLEAVGVYGIYRLAARVFVINKTFEKQGSDLIINCERRRDRNGKQYGRYTLGSRSAAQAAA